VVTAAIYCRISQDREGGGLGVARQGEDCQALCERLGWSVADTYVDNDVSAYSGKPRPEWMRLLGDIQAKRVGAIAVWHIDRLTRSPVELEHVIDLADQHGLKMATVTGEVDLATPTGRMVARILGATARQESEHKGERQRRQMRQAAEAGKPNGGGARPFGYEDDRIKIDESEAIIVREMCKRTLMGESLSSICRDLQVRKVKTTKGNYWQVNTLRRYLASARLSGRREHFPPRTPGNGTRPLMGEIVAPAVWGAIISVRDSDRLRSMLSDPSRRTSSAIGRTYLLSGILKCGRCGASMTGRPRAGVPRYVCANLPGTKNCGGVATNTVRTDDYIMKMILRALSDTMAFRKKLEDLARASSEQPEVERAVEEDQAKLVDLATLWGDGGISRSEWITARNIVEERLERNRAKMTTTSATGALNRLPKSVQALKNFWEGASHAEKRAVILGVVEKIIVNPADTSKRWDPNRFDFIWRV
jgi:site-specific DNA recombinase